MSVDIYSVKVKWETRERKIINEMRIYSFAIESETEKKMLIECESKSESGNFCLPSAARLLLLLFEWKQKQTRMNVEKQSQFHRDQVTLIPSHHIHIHWNSYSIFPFRPAVWIILTELPLSYSSNFSDESKQGTVMWVRNVRNIWWLLCHDTARRQSLKFHGLFFAVGGWQWSKKKYEMKIHWA